MPFEKKSNYGFSARFQQGFSDKRKLDRLRTRCKELEGGIKFLRPFLGIGLLGRDILRPKT